MFTILIINLPPLTFVNKDKIMIEIRSGGQTGADRAALDAAKSLNLSIGGWCPQGRIDENGVIPPQYGELKEIEGTFNSEKENYDARTKRNIQDSDATLILVPRIPLPTHIKDGTVLTINEVGLQDKKHFLFDLSLSDNEELVTECIEWIKENNINILNIAGPRESSSPGIYKASYDFLLNFLTKLQAAPIFVI